MRSNAHRLSGLADAESFVQQVKCLPGSGRQGVGVDVLEFVHCSGGSLVYAYRSIGLCSTIFRRVYEKISGLCSDLCFVAS